MLRDILPLGEPDPALAPRMPVHKIGKIIGLVLDDPVFLIACFPEFLVAGSFLLHPDWGGGFYAAAWEGFALGWGW